ncbi:MAG: hypothetical protein JJ896_18320 [Rhodothermales bacterium]|nr:hypothetical protein [Rhodothermales bacterium]MBO6781620.1 hypothetical protein [Rhodothermales bacterium]
MENLTTSAPATETRIREIVDTVIAQESAYVVEIVVRGRQGSRVVEVFLDSDDGLGLDVLARFSREIGFLIEAEDLIKGKYRLNVSSPGADRAMTLPRQLKKHVGRTLSVTRTDGSVIEGDLRAVTDHGIVLASKGGEQTLDLDAFQEARVVLPW